MSRPPSAVPSQQVGFRFPLELIARLDRYAAELTEQTPGARFTRADAVRSLLTRALDELEAGAEARSFRAPSSSAPRQR